eukprot:812594-Prymnesium_polylepis.1
MSCTRRLGGDCGSVAWRARPGVSLSVGSYNARRGAPPASAVACCVPAGTMTSFSSVAPGLGPGGGRPGTGADWPPWV